MSTASPHLGEVVVMTLFEAGHYEIGAMTLINSLVRSGYRGSVWCGVRGRPPSWARDIGPVEVHAVPVDPPHHLMNHKADFILAMVDRLPDAEAYMYLDPDIVVKCPWADLADWSLRGIAAIADTSWFMPASSPVRARWRELRDLLAVPELSGETGGQLDIYCNSGFVGVPRRDLAMVALWRELMHAALAHDIYGDTTVNSHLKVIGHLDQELFNLALMSFAERCSLRGPEAMDFAPAGEVLSHAIGSPKPWQKRFIRRALLGTPPSKIDREFLRYCTHPLPAIEPQSQRRRLASYLVGRAIGNVYKRSDY